MISSSYHSTSQQFPVRVSDVLSVSPMVVGALLLVIFPFNVSLRPGRFLPFFKNGVIKGFLCRAITKISIS